MMSKQETELMQAREYLLQFAEECATAPEAETLKAAWQRTKEIGKSESRVTGSSLIFCQT